MAKITGTAAILLVKDFSASQSYWETKLGFEANVWGDPANFGIFWRDDCAIMLSEAPKDHEVVPHWRVNQHIWNTYFWVDDARAFYEEFIASGAKIDYHLGMKPYGVLEFGIQDLDGHDIAFGQDVAKNPLPSS